MNLKNYTSSIDAMRTISYIETYLMNCGQVSGIAKEIKDGVVAAIVFEAADDKGQKRLIKLPANTEAVHEFLWRDYCSSAIRPRKTKEDFKEQASRCAWKIMQDWVQVQMSLIKLKQADLLQVFLPYIWDGQQTYYEYLKGSHFKALPAPKEDAQ
jgi:hypothetical protein